MHAETTVKPGDLTNRMAFNAISTRSCCLCSSRRGLPIIVQVFSSDLLEQSLQLPQLRSNQGL